MKIQLVLALLLIFSFQTIHAQTPATPAAAPVAPSTAPTDGDEDSPKHPCHHERMTLCQGKKWKEGAGKCLVENYAQLGPLCKTRIDTFKAKHPNIK